MRSKIYAQLGRRIQALRKAHDLTQNELAEKSDIALSYLVKLEAGTRKARLEVVERLASALAEPVSALFTDRRSALGEDKWRGEASKLADAVRELDEDDIKALVAVARRLVVLHRKS